MAQKSIQIADKPTLDAAKALLEDSGVGLAAIKEAVSSGAASGSAGGLQIGKIVDEQVNGCVSVSSLPYDFYYGSAVVYNNELHILGSRRDYKKHYLVKFDNRHIATMLPKGVHILLSDNEDILYTNNASRLSSNVAEVTETGYVELLAAPTEIENIKGYLTFY